MKLNKGFLILCLFLGACSSDHGHHEEHIEKVEIEDVPEDFIVPQVVWDAMKPALPTDKEKPILYSAVTVNFSEKNHGVLRSPKISFEFPRGGGEIDLSKLTGSKEGTYFLHLDTPELESAAVKKAFFISQSRQRKVDGEILGSGCKKVLDISASVFGSMKKEGLKMNTTRLRHDSILGGHLILMAETDKNWLLSQVTFFDSARMDLFCKGFRMAEAR